MNLKKYLIFATKKPLNIIGRIIFYIKTNISIKDKNLYVNKNSYQFYLEDEMKSSFNHFSKYFHSSIFLNKIQIKNYAIDKAVKLENDNEECYYLEFGVHIGRSIKVLSKRLNEKIIYGFDSFVGLQEDWNGSSLAEGHFNLKGKLPRVNNNCILIKGWINETLPKFIENKKLTKINFIHIDVDTYETTKYILETLKPFLVKNSIILFDEIYDVPGWKMGELKGLQEVFNENEYKFIAFGKDGGQAVIKII